MQELERRRKLEAQEVYKDSNKKFALYVALAFNIFPYTWYRFDMREGRYRSTEEIPLQEHAISSVRFFHDDGQPFFTDNNELLRQRYGVMVSYNPTAPENIMEYRDIDDDVRIAKRIQSRFGFTLGGLSEMHHYMPDKYVNGKHIESHNNDMSFYGKIKENYYTPLPLDDEEFQQRMVKVTRKPTRHERSGGFVIDLGIEEVGWMEFVGNLFQTVSDQYPQLQNFREYGKDWIAIENYLKNRLQ